jgi:hypothetical protein
VIGIPDTHPSASVESLQRHIADLEAQLKEHPNA